MKLIVNVPTRVTKNMATLLHVVITNNSLRVMNLGLSDHHAQILSVSIIDARIITYRMKIKTF